MTTLFRERKKFYCWRNPLRTHLRRRILKGVHSQLLTVDTKDQESSMSSKMYDLRFKSPSTFILVGSSQSGKTTFTLNVLRSASELFEDSRCVQNVLFYYKHMQPSYESVEKEGLVNQWVNQVPTKSDIQDRTMLYKNSGGSIVIIDDFGDELTSDILHIFTALSHHYKLHVFLLLQTLYSKNPLYRAISLNATYIVIFKNPRDTSQIRTYARQFSSGNVKYIIESFHQATKLPYSYLLFDHHQLTPEILRVRSRVLPHQQPMIVWRSTNET